jgi:triosephosphate isomerase
MGVAYQTSLLVFASAGSKFRVSVRASNVIGKNMRPLIAGNWKMHGLESRLAEIEAIVTSVRATPPAADILICPPYTLIARAAQTAAGSIAIGEQNCRKEIGGPFTGDITEMLKDAGASTVIVGHSERRRYHAETDVMVAAKAKAAWRADLLAIICVGETASQRRDGRTLSVCGDQISGSVPEGMTLAANAVAYEPLWAIGTGRSATPEEIVEVHGYIRRCLVARLGPKGKEVRILYGGSVEPSNAREILALPDVGGVLVGGESLNAADFEAIFRAASAKLPGGLRHAS